MPSRLDRALPWISRLIAVAALAVVLAVSVSSWGAITHGHPSYAIWLGATAAAALASLLWSLRARAARHGWRRVMRVIGMVAAVTWVGVTAWLRPFPAVEPALAAMESDGRVVVTESATRIVMEPAEGATGVGVVFYPGARVDPRAYAAHLAQVAETGHPVVIVKEPLGIAFLSLGSLADVSAGDGGSWVAAGHSLGGTVATLEAESASAAGLVLWASYPAGDMSDWDGAVLSVSGSEDGLSTPDAIEASRADLPPDAVFHEVAGATHAQFGSYGEQPGDGFPSIDAGSALMEIAQTTVLFLDESTVAG